jgi:hypothetical protein
VAGSEGAGADQALERIGEGGVKGDGGRCRHRNG